jgi:hypothetical protein
MKYNHLGIPTTANFDGEIPLPHLKVTVSDHQNNPFGIQWQRYWDGAPYPDLVQTVPHVAFEIDDLAEAIRDQKVIVAPNSPSNGVLVAMIEVNGAPVELMQIDHLVRKDLWPSRSAVPCLWPPRLGTLRSGRSGTSASGRSEKTSHPSLCGHEETMGTQAQISRKRSSVGHAGEAS